MHAICMSSEGHPQTLKFAVLAADTALFTVRDGALFVRLITVNRPPYYTNVRGLPGGLLDPSETADEAALRHLEDKAGISSSHTYAEQLYTFSAVDRDPRGRVVAVTYLALASWEALTDEERLDTDSAQWVLVKDAKRLAYDHTEVLAMALTRLRSRVVYTTLISKLMPREFTLTELEQTYECILKSDLDKRNFRKKILKLGILSARNKKRQIGRSRPAELYSFSSPTVKEIEVL